ncbi:SDR family oxidoreductase [Sphingobacterium thalpophilum]|uniref:SDR family oxidoreductase n=1 Tax=Sphingobacterium thalpophilum TaxID=259 RepID=UPI0024A6CB0A|nr:SDR family oxidoreductase [Sphingobacterium thalpophilum]
MRILLTGVTGYIGKRLLPVLLEQGHDVICCVRDKDRFDPSAISDHVQVIEVDFLDKESLKNIPLEIDIAYFLIHSMATQSGDFQQMEAECANNFRNIIEKTNTQQIIYLSGIINSDRLSKHLDSRRNVESILANGRIPITTLRAGIIVGSGSASFEIIRDLVEKLPIMITPKWLKTKCQPIAIRNVIEFMTGVIANPHTFNKSYDIGGPDILSYKEMLLQYAAERKLRRKIYILPLMTPRLSSYWLYFVTSTSYHLAKNLVDSMKVEVICKANNLADELGIKLINYSGSIQLAFQKIESDNVVSSWKDAQTSKILSGGLTRLLEVPSYGCFKDIRKASLQNSEASLTKIWSIGGNSGWYYGNWLWKIRGFMDQLVGGVGMRRGRKNKSDLAAGDALDFWRVLIADRTTKRLLLYAEMKLPGEAWLEFKIEENLLIQTATFRPLGIAGRIYWYAVWPFHGFIFRGMINSIATT